MLEILLIELQRAKGFSFDIVKCAFCPRVGYAVSAHKQREAIISNFAALSRIYLSNRLAVYIVENLDLLLSNGHILSAWVNGNKCYLDVATVVPTRETADLLAREHAQVAFFDLESGQAISVTGGK